MDVQLYVYDLTRGMARQFSQQFLGISIDAVYHTALVFGGIEYFFGAGVQTCYPGTTHHGQPMEKIPLGTTQLPLETILEYLESLKEVYTPESYDLFAHNCNNFTNDFAQFLVGRGIPEHITNLPKRVLETPFGQMLKPQIDASMRSITQAPVPQQNIPRAATTNGSSPSNGSAASSKKAPQADAKAKIARFGRVVNASSLDAVKSQLRAASDTAATIFFTSSTCAPCKLAYPMFDQLAEQYGDALFLKIDINGAQDVAACYQIRATPTFITFSREVKHDQWSGADPNQLKTNVEKLLQHTYPPHPHTQIKVPTLQFGSMKPVTYTKVPPLDKLTAKLGQAGNTAEIAALRSFIATREKDARNAALPDLKTVGQAFQTRVLALPLEVRFAAVDLLRCAMVDARVSGFFAEESNSSTIAALVKHVIDLDICPHNLRLVTIHLACNIFTSPLYVQELMKEGSTLAALLVQLITTSLLDASHPTTRVASASLAFNLAISNYRIRRETGAEGLGETEQVELAASLLETLSNEESNEASKALLLALGYLVYCAPQDGELMDLMKVLDAKSIVSGCKEQQTLAKEVALLV